MKVLIPLLILTIGTSGCSLFKERLIDPLCLPERPSLESISIEEQRAMDRETLRKVAENDVKLKSWIVKAERSADAHNQQFKAKCEVEEL